jgi:hypothetical protein
VLESRQQKSAIATALMGTRSTPAALGSALASAGRLVGKSEINFPQAGCSAAVAGRSTSASSHFIDVAQLFEFALKPPSLSAVSIETEVR